MDKSKDADPPAEEAEPYSLIRRLRELIPFGRSPDTTEALEHEIQELLEEGEEQGLISSLEERMISSIFEFRETSASEVMTPAAEIFSLEASTPLSEIIKRVIEEGYTRIPIYRDNGDQIIGILHVKDLLQLCTGTVQQPAGLQAFLNEPYFVPESKPIVDLLKEFQKKKNHMAIVMDEFGAVRGLVTLEDILEEIVGEIDDEYDVDNDDFETIDDYTYLVRARVDIEDVEERLQIKLPEGPYESIGGLIIHLLGRIGTEGDLVTVGEVRLIVQSAGRRRIKKVKIVLPGQPDTA
ncbi:hemolysin family protein [Desulfofustis glycolicus]|uniref:CBS domain-containing protein n=1 Tax=Desulfofustis glycolicus DSM 9705 TaxID=1121409 RepID=A0A1M5SBK6_9BACT|nr:hemolysin family protein [Desulfofustis glycolicus]MCB2216167.1 hemolysin family protein [Desulfobulbaceae bacterium]SHH35841.1 CBS domain-containing protein [Desulfofustis glycolicus DSM 9705]